MDHLNKSAATPHSILVTRTVEDQLEEVSPKLLLLAYHPIIHDDELPEVEYLCERKISSSTCGMAEGIQAEQNAVSRRGYFAKYSVLRTYVKKVTPPKMTTTMPVQPWVVLRPFFVILFIHWLNCCRFYPFLKSHQWNFNYSY